MREPVEQGSKNRNVEVDDQRRVTSRDPIQREGRKKKPCQRKPSRAQSQKKSTPFNIYLRAGKKTPRKSLAVSDRARQGKTAGTAGIAGIADLDAWE